MTEPVRVRLRYPDLDTFVERYAPNITRGGIFIATRKPPAVGTVVAFELALADGSTAFSGEGRVSWVKPFDEAQPTRAHGAGLQFTRVDPASKSILDRILAAKGDAKRRAASDDARPAHVATPAPTPSPSPGGADAAPDEDVAKAFGVDDATIERVLAAARGLGARYEDLEALTRSDDDQG